MSLGSLNQGDADRYGESNKMLGIAEHVIPLGSQTFSKSHTQFPVPFSPLFLDRGKGNKVWDVDENEYIDLISGLLSISLGYCDEDVDKAISDQLKKGISFSLANSLEIELAETLTALNPCAEMVRFGKNGTDATSAGVRLARAFTGREKIIVLGYHGWQDWYIGATTRNLGVPDKVCDLTHKIPFNDQQALVNIIQKLKGEVAAVVMEPVSSILPDLGYLEFVREVTRENNILLIFDEIVTGFRIDLGGAQKYYNVTPDLAAFGKGMGNGMPISAIVGRADIMSLMRDVFYSGTFGGEALSIAASIATIKKMQTCNVIEHMWGIGDKLASITNQIIDGFGIQDYISLTGLPPWKCFVFKDYKNVQKEAIKTRFMIENLKQGLLISTSHNISYSHNEVDVDRIAQVYTHTFEKISLELKNGTLLDNLETSLVFPVFQVRQ